MENLSGVLEFLIITVGAKMIIGHWIAERITTVLKKWFATTDRKQAIWDHYQARAKGIGHNSDDVIACNQGKCSVFHMV